MEANEYWVASLLAAHCKREQYLKEVQENRLLNWAQQKQEAAGREEFVPQYTLCCGQVREI